MKVAIVSDIHADARALRRAFDDMPSVDRVLCAGDACSDFRFCPETVDLLREAKAQCILGNHENMLFGGGNPGYLAKCRIQFAADALAFLSDAPESLDLEWAGVRIHMIHATPWSPFSGYIHPGSPQLPRFAKLPYDVVILGHTHVPMVERAGDVTVLNPGSPSQPRDGDRRGSYAVLDLDARATTIHRFSLD
ncbi:MAG: metallophosphoesterase [Hyphomicrobiaceae bacterium]